MLIACEKIHFDDKCILIKRVVICINASWILETFIFISVKARSIIGILKIKAQGKFKIIP